MNNENKEVRAIYSELMKKFDHLPFLFVGSGISRRYMGLPDWESLLRYFAEKVYPKNPLALEVFSSSDVNLKWQEVASRIEKEFNHVWLTDKLFEETREEYKDLVRQGISPFKIELAMFFKSAKKQKDNLHLIDELACLINVGKRSVAGIITTNYDLLLEDVFSGYNVFVGQEQLLFSETQGIAEIYKIHGCCNHPDSIVINENDYEEFNRKNAYLAAKLLTVFVEHPIIFIGYSLNDPNVLEILKAIADCLTQDNLSKLKNRFIFVEYSAEPLDNPQVQSHTINFGGNMGSLEMMRIKIHDYLPFYSELLSRKYHYNPKMLRQLKRDIYQLITTNEPVDSFQIVDIEDDEQLINLETVVGIGVAADSGHHIPKAEDLYADIILDNGDFDLKSLVEEALGYLLKHCSGSLPLHKYLEAYFDRYKKVAPINVTQYAKNTLEGFLNQSLIRKRKQEQFTSFDNLKQKYPQDEKIIENIPLLTDEALTVENIGGFLKNYLNKNKIALNGTNQSLKTNLKRVIKIYDWLKYGKN